MAYKKITPYHAGANSTNITKVGIANSDPQHNLDVVGNTNSDSLSLSSISTDILDTAVDVFIYDTRKDSDGGAWRKRTQHTSWYNETLNTSIRSDTRREFPAVAVIVAEIDQVTIYDGDDPDMPMWMVFNQGGTWSSSANLIMPTSPDPVSISFLNGILSIAYSNGYGVGILDFISESKTTIFANNVTHYHGNISQRNDGVGHSSANDARRIVNSEVKDVAMTVLPNAPIDAATGLPVPTIAVATDGGVSVIKDDGTVADLVGTSQTESITDVEFLSDTELLYSHGYATVVNSIPTADQTNNYFNQLSGYQNRVTNTITHQSDGTPYVTGTTTSKPVKTTDAQFAVASNNTGFGLYNNVTSSASSYLQALITYDYNTGWFNDTTKLVTLSDTDDTDVIGSELVTDGDFPSLTNWPEYGDCNSSIVNGELLISYSTTTGVGVQQAVSLEAGKKYVVAFTTRTTVSGQPSKIDFGGFDVTFNGVSSTGTISGTEIRADSTTNVRVFATFTANATGSANLRLRFNYQAGAYYDDVSVRLAEEDRSVNVNGLQVFGTVTKNPVATGADLVAYSGFSGSNKLAQPYNSDLNWGSGDFSIMLWVNTSNNTTSSAEYYLARGYIAPSWTNHSWYLRQNVSTNYIEYAVTENGFSTRDIIQSPSAVALNTWTQICVVKRGSNHEMYFDGRLVKTASTTRSHTNADNAPFVIGDYGVTGAGAFLDGSIALVRLSATAPSPEQIKKIYEDEKVLFQENAQATLYGSSDAVTALAYDDSTELLHVGTSAGRSVFQGLKRVDNTTDAVESAISASNGMVAED